MAEAIESNFLGTSQTVDVRPAQGTTERLTNAQTIHWSANGDCQAALITHVYEDGSTIDLVAFVGGVFFATGVARGSVGQVATWHLPTAHEG